MSNKIEKKKTKLPAAFSGDTARKTERSAVATMNHWMRNIIESKNLELGSPDVETISDDRKMPDAVIYESQRSDKVLCVIEAKPPYYDVFDEKELKEPARSKATTRKAKYFVLTNFKKLIWYNTEKVNAMKPEEEQIVEKYSLSEIDNLDNLEQVRYSEAIKKNLDVFLTKLHSVHTGREPEPRQAIDDFLVFRLQEKIRVLATYYRTIIDDRCHKDNKFANQIKKWFLDQKWTFSWQPQDFDKIARQTAYLLVNKILFFNLLQAKRPKEMDPLCIHYTVTKSDFLKRIMQIYFDQILKIDYETIFSADFIDSIGFPDAIEVVEEIKKLVAILGRYDFSKLGYDIIGRIFESLIPADERHKLGQYFTNPDVVDLILKFCLHNEDDKIIDPSCGAGTFLVRAYQHKKLMNQRLEHEQILETLWGTDIAKFPAHLATINLAINDLSIDKNYPNILQDDFFTLQVGEEGFDPEEWRVKRAKTLGTDERELVYPRWFDAIVGNPPYTRQEEIGQMSSQDTEYKEKLINGATNNHNGKKFAEISKRAGIHTYFFIHGTRFLKEGGYFGFIVSNSWLDVDYGKGLQEFFLNNYKIITIIESKVERWFDEADINTCIIILQKCRDSEERECNPVRFVYLKKPLKDFIPPAQDIWEKQIDRLNEIEKLRKTILAHNNVYENTELRILPKTQKELWDEGFDPEKNEYAGAKWGKYLRAFGSYFKILEKIKNQVQTLEMVADVRRGITSGANDFFYLTDEEAESRKIETEYLKPIIFSLKEVQGYRLNRENLLKKVIICSNTKVELKGKHLLKYILWGEKQGYHKRPSCTSRSPWYSLAKDWDYAPLVIPAKVGERMPVFLNDGVFEDKKLYGITPKKGIEVKVLAALLNSTLSRLLIEYNCRQLTGAQAIADIDVVVVKSLLIPSIEMLSDQIRERLTKSYELLSQTQSESILKEIAPSPKEVIIDKIKPELRDLDKVIMGEILGLTDEEQLEIYRAVVDLVKSRLEKAKSTNNNNKTKEGINITAFLKAVMSEIGDETLGKYYKEMILTRADLQTKVLPKCSGKVTIEKDLFGWNLCCGKDVVAAGSEFTVRYLKIFLEAGMDSVQVPQDEDYLGSILTDLEIIKDNTENVFNSYLESIMDNRTREQLNYRLWVECLK